MDKFYKRVGALTLLGVSAFFLSQATGILPDSQKAISTKRYAAADSVPAVPTVTIVPNAQGLNSVVIKLTPPTKDKSGNTITDETAVTAFRIYRAGTLIKEMACNGNPVTYTDSVPEMNKSYSYSMSAVNAYGEGAKTTRSVYVGITKPAVPPTLTMEPTSDRNKFKISWTAPTADANGRPIDASELTYTVKLVNFSGTATVYRDNIKELGIDLEYTSHDANLIYVKVCAVNKIGASNDKSASDRFFVGDSFTLPYSESFSGGKIQGVLRGVGVNGGAVSFQPCTNRQVNVVTAADDDNGFYVLNPLATGNTGAVITHYLDLKGTKKPYVYFNLYKVKNQPSQNYTVVARRTDTDEIVATKNLKDLPLEGWNSIGVSLEKYKDETIQLMILLEAEVYGYIHFDNLRVMDAPDADISVAGINISDHFMAGNNEKITTRLTNWGIKDAANVDLQLYKNGTLAQTRHFDNVAPLTTMDVDFTDATSTVTDTVIPVYQVKAVYTDAQQYNNATGEFSPYAVGPSVMPVVNNLKYTNTGQSTSTISWTSPDMERIPMEVEREDFESYTSYADVAGRWTTVDGDQKNIAGFNVNGVALPVTGAHGFFIIDTDVAPGTSMFFYPHDGGHRYPVSMYLNKAGEYADDWLISPELNGEEQLISYYAAAYYNFNVTWEVYYSTTGKEPADFKKLGDLTHKTIWRNFSCVVPKGTKYFAIHSNHEGPVRGANSCCPMFDDISYIPAGKGTATLLGYNIYCDGRRMNDKPVNANSYTLDFTDQMPHNVEVTAVFDRGESRPVAVLANTSAGMMTSDHDVNVYGETAQLRIIAPIGCHVEIVTLQGARINSFVTTEGETTVTLPEGIYLVKAGSKTFKTVVR